MSRSTVALITVAVLLAGLYLYAFSDWFSTQRIQIIPAVRPVRGTQLEGAVLPVSFTLDGKYRLSSIKVVELSASESSSANLIVVACGAAVVRNVRAVTGGNIEK